MISKGGNVKLILTCVLGLAGVGAVSLLDGCDHKHQLLFSGMSPAHTGVHFNNSNEESETANILTYEYYYNGGGIAAGDINNDGLVDLYFSANTGENKLYLNEGDFHFKDITLQSRTASPQGWKTGVSMVDVNADGWLDIYVCRSGPSTDLNLRTNQLFINNGDLTFRELAWRARLNDPSYSTQTAFFDYDRDGDLDAFMLNHSFLGISNSYDISQKNTTKRHPHVGNRLLRNDDGKFTDVSDTSGVYGPASNYGLGISLSDINNDGWTDIYAGCDYTGRDRLLLNKNGVLFQDATDSLLSHISKFTMGTDIADVNNDGHMDIYTVDMLPEDNFRQKQLQGSDRYDEYNAMVRNGLHHQCMRNMLHLNNGNGTFSEVGQLMNVSSTDWSWAALFADFDNDGVQDLFVTNGFKRDLTNNDFAKFQAFNEMKEARKSGKKSSVMDAIAKFGENKIPNYMFGGVPDSAFQNKTEEWGLSHPTLSNGAIYADLDNDGDLDLVVNNINEEAGIYRNNSDRLTKNNYLKVSLSGTGKNTAAIGARVTVFTGAKMMVRELFPVRGFQSSVDPTLHFGLGKAGTVDSILVRWPDGKVTMLGTTSVNQLLKISQEDAHAEPPGPLKQKFFQEVAAPAFTHKENDFIDFREQRLLPRMYSREGPALAIADINADGITDFYFGGAAGQSAEIHIGKKGGTFIKTNSQLLSKNKAFEDVDAIFTDVNGDGSPDLYVVTGGYEMQDTTLLADKLYVNNGKGDFREAVLPAIYSAGSCVRAEDVDRDGDIDLFVGSRLVPGKYPYAPASTLLINDGKGGFSADGQFKLTGMVTDATWTDLNSDRFPDLIVTGEWMPLKVFINDSGKLTDRTQTWIAGKSEGFWNCIVGHDFDHDGDEDFVVGNQGTNSLLRASDREPLILYYDDFDANGSPDPLLTYFVQHEAYPYPSRDELTEQLPSFKKRFTDYKSYSIAGIENVLTAEELSGSEKLSVTTTTTSYLRNDNGKLTLIPMPAALQYAPVMALALIDVNGDGFQDLLSGGNISGGRARTGRMTGVYADVFLSDGKGNFRRIPPAETGILIRDDVRKIVVDGRNVIYGMNDGDAAVYRLK